MATPRRCGCTSTARITWVESSYRPEQGEWGPPTLVSQPGEEGGNPHVAIDAKGDALVAWRGEDEGVEFVRAAYRPAGGSWGAPADVSVAGEHVEQLRVAVDPDGNAIVAWAGDSGKAGAYGIVRAAFKPAGGAWEAPVGLSADGGNGFPSDVVFDSGGNAALVWQRWDGTTNLIQAAYRPAGEEWEPAVDLSEEGKQGIEAVVVLDAPGDATAADGHATAVWVSRAAGSGCAPGKEGLCGSDTVQAAGYDPDGIPAVEIEAPAEGVVGEPVEISTPTAGLFAPLIEFGDGSSAAETEASHMYEEPGEYEIAVGGAELLGYRATTRRTITIAPVGPSSPQEEADPQPAPGTSAPGGATPKENGPAAPAIERPALVASPSPGCLQAEAARDRALRRLQLADARLSRAEGSAEVRRLNAAKRRQAAALRRARQRLAGC